MLKHREISRKIIKAYYEVYNELGAGFMESVYENALCIVLNEYSLRVQRQHPITVYFRDNVIGEFRADIIVGAKVIVELKSVARILSEHEAQLINYLKATDIDVGLLMNFGKEPEFKRFIFDRNRKISRYP